MPEAGEITILLRDWSAGNPAATEHLFELVYPQLRKIAGALFRGERPENLLQPTSVVNELFLKLVRQRSLRFEDREHFYSLSARLMRRVLIDQARSEGREKRDGGVRVPLAADFQGRFTSRPVATQSPDADTSAEKSFGWYFSKSSCRTKSGLNTRWPSCAVASAHHCCSRSHFGGSSRSSLPFVSMTQISRPARLTRKSG